MRNIFFAAAGIIFAIFVAAFLANVFSQKIENKCNYTACSDVLNPANTSKEYMQKLNCQCQCESQRKLLTNDCKEAFECAAENGCARIR